MFFIWWNVVVFSVVTREFLRRSFSLEFVLNMNIFLHVLLCIIRLDSAVRRSHSCTKMRQCTAQCATMSNVGPHIDMSCPVSILIVVLTLYRTCPAQTLLPRRHPVSDDGQLF